MALGRFGHRGVNGHSGHNGYWAACDHMEANGHSGANDHWGACTVGEPMALKEPWPMAREESVPYLYIYLQQPLSNWGADSVRPRNALKQASALWT